MPLKICQCCGAEISVASKAKKYCSEPCRRRAKYEKDRAWLAARPDKGNEYCRKWRVENPEAANKIARNAYRRRCQRKFEEDKGNV
jgi:hypothetical protein